VCIAQIREKNHGFVLDSDLPAIIEENRFQMLLVRCGAGRFVAPAQDIKHFIDIIGREGSDYVRDVSFPANGTVGKAL
jgi:hypothetical protein